MITKSKINSLFLIQLPQKPFPTCLHYFWKSYCATNSLNGFPHRFRKNSSKQNKNVGKLSLVLFRYLFLCLLDLLLLWTCQWSVRWACSGSFTCVKTTHKINFQVSVYEEGGNENWAFVSVILKNQSLTWQVISRRYDFD